MPGILRTAIAIAIVCGGSAACTAPPFNSEPSISIADADRGMIPSGKVSVGEKLVVYPGVISSDGKQHIDAERSAVGAGLLNAHVLRKWSLCSVELKAAAVMIRGYADAIYAFPQDKPLNNARSEGAITPEEATRAQRARALAGRYDTAARLAKRADVPCIKQGQALDVGNYATLAVTVKEGKRIALHVPDYRVVGSSLMEYMTLRNYCVSMLSDKLEGAKASVVDAKPGMHNFLDTYTERNKAEAIVAYRAEIDMVRASGMDIPCK